VSKLLFLIRTIARACLDSDIIGIKADCKNLHLEKQLQQGWFKTRIKSFLDRPAASLCFYSVLLPALDRKKAARAIESDMRGIKEDQHANPWSLRTSQSVAARAVGECVARVQGHNKDPRELGEYVPALANSAMLLGRDRAFLVFGIEDRTKRRVGTELRLQQPKQGNEDFTNWLARMVEPRVLIEVLDLCATAWLTQSSPLNLPMSGL